MTDLRSPEEVWREAAYEYGGLSIPGEGEDRAAWVIKLDREQVERDTIRRVVEWLRGYGFMALDEAADKLEAGEWKQ